MRRLAFVALLLAIPVLALAHDPAAPGFGYEAGFGYQAAPSHSHSRSYDGYRRPSREVTTITPLENGGRRIETRRYYEPKKGGRVYHYRMGR